MHSWKTITAVAAHKYKTFLPDDCASGVYTPNRLHNYWYINCIQTFNDLITPLHVEQKAATVPRNAPDKRRHVCSPSPRTFVHIRVKLWVVKLWNRHRYCIGSLPSLIIHGFEEIHSSTDLIRDMLVGPASLCASYIRVRENIMEILRGMWSLITAQNKSRGDMEIDRRFSPSRLQVVSGIETTPSVRTSQVILLLEGDSYYEG